MLHVSMKVRMNGWRDGRLDDDRLDELSDIFSYSPLQNLIPVITFS
jgi:hypothetical protein